MFCLYRHQAYHIEMIGERGSSAPDRLVMGRKRSGAKKVVQARPETALVVEGTEPERIRELLLSMGHECGPLEVFAVRDGGRTVLSDRKKVVVRYGEDEDPMIRAAQHELDRVPRVSQVLRVQHPLFGSPLRIGQFYTATAWEWVPGDTAGPEFARQHGVLLRLLHDNVDLAGDEASRPIDQVSVERNLYLRLTITDPERAALVRPLLGAADKFLRDEKQPPYVFCHGKTTGVHLLAGSGNDLTMMDFGESGAGPRTFDLAAGARMWARLAPEGQKDEAVADFLSGYGAHEDVTDSSLAEMLWVRDVCSLIRDAYTGMDITEQVRILDS